MAIESAEEFARMLVTHLADTLIASKMPPAQAKAHAIALIEADRAAVALEAKREVLREIRSRADEVDEPNDQDSDCVYQAFCELEAKHWPPTDQKPEGGANG